MVKVLTLFDWYITVKERWKSIFLILVSKLRDLSQPQVVPSKYNSDHRWTEDHLVKQNLTKGSIRYK